MERDGNMDKKQKDKLIKQEQKKLTLTFSDLDKDKKIFADRLIGQASFMFATLQELQETINEEGAVELFVNGRQEMLREHPATKIYNSMIKHYMSIVKQLIDLTPKEKTEKNELLDFLSSDVK